MAEGENDLLKLIDDLHISSPGAVPTVLDQLKIKLENVTEECDIGEGLKYFHELLSSESLEIVEKTAGVIAVFSRTNCGRKLCCTPILTTTFINLLKQNCGKLDQLNIQVLVQSCRALANLCFENSPGQKYVMDNEGVGVIMKVIQFSIFLDPSSDSSALRSVSTGLLLNLLMNQDQLYPKVLEMGTMDSLCSILEQGVTDENSEQAAIHCLIITNFLIESTPGDLLMNERLCQAVVKILEQSTLGELSELCVELLHSQAANDCVGLYLSRAGLCELLMKLLEKHRPAAEDDDLRNLMKMACDVIIHILNGDEAMTMLYADGKGKLFQGMVEWLSSPDEDMMITAILAMANFAHSDNHSIQLVKYGVAKKLLTILSRNNTPEADIRLQHSLLCALRNLVIPSENKSIVLEEGLLDVLLPMTDIPTFPVVFKLLGTLRIVIDGQENTACMLGTKPDLISKFCEWSKTEDHPGVQAEACRLLAWIIKNSRDREVMGVMVQCGAVFPLVNMITVEHQVMQTEALLSISLITIMRLADAETSLLQSKVGEKLNELLTKEVPREIFSNILTLVGQLMSSSKLKIHLRDVAISRSLTSFVASNEKFLDLRDHVARLSTMLGSEP